VKRQLKRNLLLVGLLTSAAFAAWAWWRPYAWNPDPAARCEVVATQVTRDHGYFWLDVRLKVNSRMTHDLAKPVFLKTGGGKNLEPADTKFAGQEGLGTTGIWLKFWLEPTDFTGPLLLHLNDGTLVIKAGHGPPELGLSPSKNFNTNQW
jgi:hypothetical protein